MLNFTDNTINHVKILNSSDNGRKERLIEILSQLSLEDLALTMATGLDCKHCPVVENKGKCYDKVVCFRNMMWWLEKD